MSNHATMDPFRNSPSCDKADRTRPTNPMGSYIRYPRDQYPPVALVGFSIRFPQDAVDAEAFWKVILENRCTSTPIPPDRLRISSFYHKDGSRPDCFNVKNGHFIQGDQTAFDAAFFSISPNEAASMDPQHRNLLETTYKALENAAISLDAIRGSRTGVFTGAFTDDFKISTAYDPLSVPKYAATGTQLTMLAARLSWFFDLKGPCANFDTACSSSMVALDAACRSLHSGDCDTAIVGGANALLGPDSWQSMSNMGFLSPEGRCFSFDSRANGYARGEGYGVLVLKPLKSAIAEGHTIRAIIRSTATNQDGHSPGITQPTSDSQESLIRFAYSRAGLDPNVTRYIEAHGTGTPLGDPAECSAIGAVFSSFRSQSEPLYVGSVKSNIGHLEGASGIAGVIKALIALESGVIPPTANFKTLNPRIDADSLHLAFATEASPWPGTGVRRASVNSFGFGGSNAHAVLDDVHHFLEERGLTANHITVDKPPRCPSVTGKSSLLSFSRDQRTTSRETLPMMLIMSAQDKSGVRRQAEAYETFFKTSSYFHLSDTYLNALSYTVNTRRTQFQWRSSIILTEEKDFHELTQSLSAPICFQDSKSLCLVFSGQGAQYARMGIELKQIPTFNRTIILIDAILQSFGCKWSVWEELEKQASESRIHSADLSQPICTALQIALIEFLKSIGLEPAFVIGHSSGEIAAAYALGALSLESAMKVAYFRGYVAKIIESHETPGAMLAVALGEIEIGPYLNGFEKVSIACHNSQRSLTISGCRLQLTAIKDMLDKDRIFNTMLPVKVAYHAVQMNQVAQLYLGLMGRLEPGETRKCGTTMISSVYNKIITASVTTEAQYWVDNLTRPVLFHEAFTKVLELKPRSCPSPSTWHILEVGPHSVLKGPIKDMCTIAERSNDAVYLSVLHKKKPAFQSLLETMGHLYCFGYPVPIHNLNNRFRDEHKQPPILTHLPSYQFNHERSYLTESRTSRRHRLRPYLRDPLLGIQGADWNPHQPRWRNFIRSKELPWILDHRINGQLVYPAAGMLVMAIQAVKQIVKGDIRTYLIKEATFLRAIQISESAEGTEVQISLNPVYKASNSGSTAFIFNVFSFENEDWHHACRGEISIEITNHNWSYGSTTETSDSFGRLHLPDTRTACKADVDCNWMYEFLLNEVGIGFGQSFQLIRKSKIGGDSKALSEVSCYIDSELGEETVIHPVTLDAFMQTAYFALTAGGRRQIPTTVPTSLQNLWIKAKDHSDSIQVESLDVCAQASFLGFRNAHATLLALDRSSHEVIIKVDHLFTTHLTTKSSNSKVSSAPRPYSFELQWKPDVSLLSESGIRRLCENTTEKASDNGPMLNTQDKNDGILSILDILAHKNPLMDVLISSDEGFQNTSRILEIFSYDQQVRLRKCDIVSRTCSLAGDFHKNFPLLSPLLSVMKMDLTANLNGQQRHFNDYDLAVLDWTSHRIDRDSPSMLKFHDLIKPCGKLILHGDLTNVSDIQEKLQTAGFSSNFVLSGALQKFIIASKSTTRGVSCERSNIFVLLNPESSLQQDLYAILRVELRNWNYRSIMLNDIRPDYLHDSVVVSLLELDKDFLFDISEANWAAFKTLVTECKKVLWVSSNGVLNPKADMIIGLARTLRSEGVLQRFVTISLQDPHEIGSSSAAKVSDCIDRILTLDDSDLEPEYRWKDGRLEVCRVRQTRQIDSILESLIDEDYGQLQQLTIRECPPLELMIGSPGLLDTFYFQEDRSFKAPLCSNEIEIEVEVVDINFIDLLTVLGQLRKDKICYICAGVVTRVGTRIESSRVGRRVIAWYPGCSKTHIRTTEEFVVHCPDFLKLTEAVTVPVPYLTTFYSLINMANLQPGEKVLIHSAAGGTGQAAVQIAKQCQAEIYATVGSETKKDFLIETYGIPSDHIFNSRDASFAQGLLHSTQGYGVDVILNSLSDEKLTSSWELIAPFGRFIEIGKKDVDANSSLSMRPFSKNVSFHCFDLVFLITSRPKLFSSLMGTIINWISTERLQIQRPISVYSASNLSKAFRWLQSGKSLGKIVISLDKNDKVAVSMKARNPFEFPSDATYLIAGGLGALGMSITRWMASRGARNFILLSRSGPRNEQQLRFLSEVGSGGVRIEVPHCDVTSVEILQNTIGSFAMHMPPIRGCIQSAATLQDKIFENMDYGAWSAAVRPKVQGSWNLHQVLPQGLDFFVLLSSVAGVVGFPGQSNYAAGNTFQDALAAYRCSQGQKTIAIDLGWVKGQGIASQGERIEQNLSATSALGTTELSELHAVLDYVCNPDITIDMLPAQSQLILGINLPRKLRAKGHEWPAFANTPKFSSLDMQGIDLVEDTSGGDGGLKNSAKEQDITTALAKAKSSEEALDMIETQLMQKLQNMLGLEAENMKPLKPMSSYGIDSLIALELRTWCGQRLGTEIAVFEILKVDTVRQLSEAITKKTSLYTGPK